MRLSYGPRVSRRFDTLPRHGLRNASPTATVKLLVLLRSYKVRQREKSAHPLKSKGLFNSEWCGGFTPREFLIR